MQLLSLLSSRRAAQMCETPIEGMAHPVVSLRELDKVFYEAGRATKSA